MHVPKINKKKGDMDLKEGKERFVEGFEGRKWNGEIM